MKSDITTICSLYGMTYLNGYINADNKFNCLCSCGREWYTYLATIKRGGHCKACYRDKRLLSNNAIIAELDSLGLKLLHPYMGNKIPIIYECDCGSIGKTVINKLRHGSRCGNCAEYDWRKKFQDYGCEVLYYFSADSITYLCSCGNVYDTTARNWFAGSKQCPKCRVIWNYNPNAVYSRKGMYAWKKTVLERDNYNCVSCGSIESLHIHHILAFHTHPDLAAEASNGITLCKTCHAKLHSKYGINVGLINLLTEFNLIYSGDRHEKYFSRDDKFTPVLRAWNDRGFSRTYPT